MELPRQNSIRTTLFERVRGVNPLLTKPSGFPKMDILDLRDAKLGCPLKASKKTISHGVEDHNFYTNTTILTMAHVETIIFTI